MISNFDPQCITYSQMNLIFNTRLFYRRLTIWTREYIVSRYLGLGTPEELFSRFYLETLGSGNFIRPFFGREAANHYSQLLSTYAIAIRELISAQLEGNTEAANQSVNRLYQDVYERASFVTSINPYVNEAEFRKLLETYLQYTIEEANQFVSGNYRSDIELFDRLAALGNQLGDAASESLYNYVTSGAQDTTPLQDRQQCLTYEQVDTIYNIRMFWFELLNWVRELMLSKYFGIGNETEIYDRLKQVPGNYVNALRQFFGDNPAIDELQLELNTYIELIDNLIDAQIAGDTDEVNRLTHLLYQNADERAISVSKLNPFWDQNEWRIRLYNNLRLTLDELYTFSTGDYNRNLNILDELLDLAESTSGYFAQGLVNYIQNPL